METTIPAAFAAAVRRDPTTPLLTWYDDASGDRTELSGATLDNWLAKTANLLVDGAGLGAGDTAGVVLPPHWQTAAVLLGAWAAGLAVQVGGPPQPVEVLFSTPEHAGSGAWAAGDRYVTGLLPLAMPLREVPPGSVDYPTEVRNYGDHFRATQPVTPDTRALAGPAPRSHADTMRTATGRAAALGLEAGARVLIDARAYPDPADWLLAPLAAGASIVLCANLDAAKLPDRVSAERVTRTLT